MLLVVLLWFLLFITLLVFSMIHSPWTQRKKRERERTERRESEQSFYVISPLSCSLFAVIVSHTFPDGHLSNHSLVHNLHFLQCRNTALFTGTRLVQLKPPPVPSPFSPFGQSHSSSPLSFTVLFITSCCASTHPTRCWRVFHTHGRWCR